MQLSRNVLAVTAAVALISALPAAAEDLTIVSKVTPAKGAPTTATTYITAGKFRHSDGSHDSMMDLASGNMVMIDHAKKEYSEITAAEMGAAMEKFDAQMKQMQDQMKQNPQAAAMLQKMMGGAVGEPTVTKGTTPRKIAGYDCDQYVVSVGDAVKMELWATAAIAPPTQLYDVRRALAAPSGPMGQNLTKLYDEMRKIKGYGLAENLTIKMMGTSLNSSSEATEVRKGAVPASAFEIPAGYKKVQSPFVKMAK